MECNLYFALDDKAYAPCRAYETDAGIDLKSPIDIEIGAGETVSIDTGVHVQLPEGTCGLLVSKSGLYTVKGLTTTGLIDSGYTGSIVACIHNKSKQTRKINRGDKVTQLVVMPYYKVNMLKVPAITGSERGVKGFGSSGR